MAIPTPVGVRITFTPLLDHRKPGNASPPTSKADVGGLIGTVTKEKDGLASKDNTVFNKGMMPPRSLTTGFAYSSDGTPLNYNSAILSFKADGGFGAAQLAFTNTNELYFRIAWGGNEKWEKIQTV